MLPLAIIVALSAAALSGSCTGYADESGGASSILTAVVISGAIALAIGLAFILLNPDHRGAKLVAVISVASYLAAGFGAWFPLIWPFVVSVGIATGGGLLAHPMARTGDGDGRGFAVTAVVSGIAIGIAATAVVIGFWTNFDPNMGWFDGGGPSSLNVVPFALISGSIPPIAAVIAAWMTGPIDSDQPSITTSAMLVGSVVLCAAIGDGLGVLWYADWRVSQYQANYFETPFTTLLVGGAALSVGVLFAIITPDRRYLWFFAIIGAGAYIAGEIGTRRDIFTDPWQILTGLAVIAVIGAVVGFAARRKFDAGAGRTAIVGAIALLGALVGAYLVAGALLFGGDHHGRVPFSSSPLFLGGVPVAVAAVAAYLAGWVSRQPR